MIRAILCCVLVSLATATPRYGSYDTVGRTPIGSHISSSYDAEIVNQEKSESINGDYDFSYTTSDGTTHSERGTAIEPSGAIAKEGEYSFTYPDGTQAHFTYVADENGFRVSSPNIPQIPEHSLLQIERAERERAAGIIHDGSYDPSSELDYLDEGIYTSSRNHGFGLGSINPQLRSRFSNSRFRQGLPSQGLRQGFPRQGLRQGFSRQGLRQGFPRQGFRQGFSGQDFRHGFSGQRLRHGFSSPFLNNRFSSPRLNQRFSNPRFIQRTFSRPISFNNRLRQNDIHYSNDGHSFNDEVFDLRNQAHRIHPAVPIRHGVPLEVQAGTSGLIEGPLSIRRLGVAAGSRFPRVGEFNRVNGVLHPVHRDDTLRNIDYERKTRN